MLTDAHKAIRAEIKALAASHVAPYVGRMEAAPACVERQVPELLARHGVIAVTIPREYGGKGEGHLAKTITIEEISRYSGAMGAMVQASLLGVAKILHFGTEEQKRRWLPGIASGACLPTIAVTEEGCGSHVLGMTASAKRKGDDYILNGRKIYVGNAAIGHLHGVVVRTGKGKHDLSAFLVESNSPGLTVAPHKPAMGLHGFNFGELIFEDCRVPAANLLGKKGDGLAVAYSSSMLYGRPNLTAVSLGIHQAILDETTAFCRERKRYDAPLGELSTVAAKLGQMQSRLMTARLTAYHAADLLDHGQPCDAELMNAKLVNVETALDSARDAMEIHAAAGLLKDRPIERYLRDAHHIYAPAGTSDIQRLRLGEVALGTSRGQWSQRFPAPHPCTAPAAGRGRR